MGVWDFVVIFEDKFPDMRLRYLIFIAGLISTLVGKSQINQWTWIGGDSITDNSYNYGIKGIASSFNKPILRDDASYFTDKSNNIWMFGGEINTQTSDSLFNDLWEYNFISKQCFWISGDSSINQIGVYGVKGIKSPFNKPGARRAASSWTDTSGNLWLFGGYGYNNSNINGDGKLNDLWEYNISTNQWVFMSGDSGITYNNSISTTIWTKGIVIKANTPTARYYANCWNDNNNNIWLFGGIGNNGIALNDLWKYNITNNQWIWINGDSLPMIKSIYGTKGIADSINKPGGRILSTCWSENNGDLWLMGGIDFDSSYNSRVRSDLWKYFPSTNQWVWMNGDSGINRLPIYGNKNITLKTNQIGGRFFTTIWNDNKGNIWFYGGGNFDSSNKGFVYDDLWKFDITNNLFTWVAGDSNYNEYANYGVKGNSSSTNNPGAKGESYGVMDKSGNLIMINGSTTNSSYSGRCNEIWMFTPGNLDTFILTGNIITPKYQAVKNVTIDYTGSLNDYIVADTAGAFNVGLNNGNYTITPTKNNDINKTNGVTTIDLVLTQAHILGKNILNSPFKLIAADVNGDGKVSTLDLVYMKRLILGVDTTFTNTSTKEQRLWAFVDSSYKFPDTTNPFPFKDSISYTGLNANQTNQTFIGVKLGDVNWDWNPAIAKMPSPVFVRPKKLSISQ